MGQHSSAISALHVTEGAMLSVPHASRLYISMSKFAKLMGSAQCFSDCDDDSDKSAVVHARPSLLSGKTVLLDGDGIALFNLRYVRYGRKCIAHAGKHRGKHLFRIDVVCPDKKRTSIRVEIATPGGVKYQLYGLANTEEHAGKVHVGDPNSDSSAPCLVQFVKVDGRVHLDVAPNVDRAFAVAMYLVLMEAHLNCVSNTPREIANVVFNGTDPDVMII